MIESLLLLLDDDLLLRNCLLDDYLYYSLLHQLDSIHKLVVRSILGWTLDLIILLLNSYYHLNQ